MGEPFVSVILPVLDEAESIVACIAEARLGLESADLPGEIIVVDNGSTDGSARLARDAGAIVVRETEVGYGAALRRGIDEASGAILVMADADGTYDLSRLGELVEPIRRDEADVVLGARFDGANRRTMPWLHRHIGTPVLSFLVRRASGGLRVRDSQSGFRAIATDKARRMDLKTTGMEFASEMLIRAGQDGLRVAERSTGYRERLGRSKLQTVRDGFRHLFLIVLLAPHLLLVWPGIVMLGSGLALGAMALVWPLGVGLGALRWQPIFFGPILIVLGSLAAVSGAVVANRSPLLRAEVAGHFAFAGSRRFSMRCIAGGVAILALGLVIDLALFVVWLTQDTSPTRALGLAGFAQALIITGTSLAGFGVVQRVIELRDGYRSEPGRVDVASLALGRHTSDRTGGS